MKLLLDTCTFLWLNAEAERVSREEAVLQVVKLPPLTRRETSGRCGRPRPGERRRI